MRYRRKGRRAEKNNRQKRKRRVGPFDEA